MVSFVNIVHESFISILLGALRLLCSAGRGVLPAAPEVRGNLKVQKRPGHSTGQSEHCLCSKDFSPTASSIVRSPCSFSSWWVRCAGNRRQDLTASSLWRKNTEKLPGLSLPVCVMTASPGALPTFSSAPREEMLGRNPLSVGLRVGTLLSSLPKPEQIAIKHTD